MHRTALESTLHAKPRRTVAFRSLYTLSKPLQTIGLLRMPVKKRRKEGTKRIGVRQVGQQPTVPQAASSGNARLFTAWQHYHNIERG